VTSAGYSFYLTRRVSHGLILPAVLHGMFDFSLVSTSVVLSKPYAGALAAIGAYIIIAVVLLARRHRIELAAGTLRGPKRPAVAPS